MDVLQQLQNYLRMQMDAGHGGLWWAVVGPEGSKFFKLYVSGHVGDLWRPWTFELGQTQLGVP